MKNGMRVEGQVSLFSESNSRDLSCTILYGPKQRDLVGINLGVAQSTQVLLILPSTGNACTQQDAKKRQFRLSYLDSRSPSKRTS